MSTQTQTATATRTITAADVRNVFANIATDLTALCRAFQHLPGKIDLDTVLVDLSTFALNDVIDEICLQIHRGGCLVREYSYVIADDVLTAHGPPPGQLPVGAVPQDARIRLVVRGNRRRPSDYTDAWFRRLGWSDAEPLQMPPGARYEPVGAFASGGYGVHRRLMVDPRLDRGTAHESSRG